jgi:hypothetical protein
MWSSWWNENWQEKTKYAEETCSSAGWCCDGLVRVKIAFKLLFESQRPLGISSRKSADKLKMNLEKTGCEVVYWIDLAPSGPAARA